MSSRWPGSSVASDLPARFRDWFAEFDFAENFRFEPAALRGDLVGGLTSAIVALPLALAFGIAAFNGDPKGAVAGLYGAVFCGVLATLFGGTPQQITGPTGGMTVILTTVYIQVGGAQALLLACLFAGLIQILFGLVKVGRYIEYIPYPVIVGFTNGIAILIFLQQVSIAGEALLVSGITVAVIAVTPLVSRHAPKALLGLVAGTLAAIWLPDAPRIGHIPSGFLLPSLPAVPFDHWRELVAPAFTIALLGAIETLLASVVVSGAAGTRHNANKELVGQGIGTGVASLFGGIAGTGAIVRSMVNVRAGGRTRLSGIIHGLILAAIVLAFTGPVGKIPLGALAGVLMMTAIGMFELEPVLRVPKTPLYDSMVMVAVMVITVATDLITAVEIGMVLAAFLFVHRMSNLEIVTRGTLAGDSENPTVSTALPRHLRERIAVFHVEGPLFFGAAKSFVAALEDLTDTDLVLLDLSGVPVVDQTGAERLVDISERLSRQGRHLLVAGARKEVRRTLLGLGAVERIGIGRFHKTLERALAAAERLTSDRHPATGLSGALRRDLVILDIAPASREELFRTMVEKARQAGLVSDAAAVLAEVEERESAESTGLAHGVAVPHARTEAVSDILVVFARLSNEVHWPTLDGQPVRFVFLCLTPPDREARYLATLAEIAAHGRSPEEAERLAHATDAAAILSLLASPRLPDRDDTAA